MGRPPPPDEACELAFKLQSQGQSLPRIRQELKAAGYDVKSNTTVSDWAERGAANEEYIKLVEEHIEEYRGLDRDQQRWLLAKSIDQAMAIVWDTLKLADNNPKIMNVAFTHLRWMLDMRAKITNAWAPPHAQPINLGGHDDDHDDRLVKLGEVQAAIDKTIEEAHKRVERYRNGDQP